MLARGSFNWIDGVGLLVGIRKRTREDDKVLSPALVGPVLHLRAGRGGVRACEPRGGSSVKVSALLTLLSHILENETNISKQI